MNIKQEALIWEKIRMNFLVDLCHKQADVNLPLHNRYSILRNSAELICHRI